jgi:uroporphyrin-III C-methyltransferase
MFNCDRPPRPGYVWLVGAGPGAEDLITIRGRNALAGAEIVIHDDLANRALLEHCPGGCEFIYVGKRAGCHSATQHEINRLLVWHARAGRRLVRLKGGDPAIFGRLGEEIAALREAGIPFEIVPGVTAACAAAAAAGISLTQRGLASAAVLATGHECEGKTGPALDWEALAQPGATLCVYMGTRSLAPLAARLIAWGHSPDTPLLVISNVSLPTQIIRAGTLENAGELADEAQGTPSLILIGEIASVHAGQAAASRRHAEPAHV